MRSASEDSFRVARALQTPDSATAAAEALRGRRDRAAVEGLVELVQEPPSARAATAALAALAGCEAPIVLDALIAALDNPQASVRIVAAQSLCRNPSPGPSPKRGGGPDTPPPRFGEGVGGRGERTTPRTAFSLVRVLNRDESWLARRAALDALAELPGPDRFRVLDAATDPHWRVRHALIRVLLRWGQTDEQRREIEERLRRTRPDARAEGVRLYLHCRWSGRPPQTAPPAPDDPTHAADFWDWDAAVLARNLERLGRAGRRQALDAMPFLLGHTDARVRSVAVDALRTWGDESQLALALALLDEPRNGVGESVARLLGYLDLDRTEALARSLLHLSDPSPAALAWAIDRAGGALPWDEEEPTLLGFMQRAPALPAVVRRALARLAARWPHAGAPGWLAGLLDDADPDVQCEALRGLSQKPGAALPGLPRFLESLDPCVRAEAVAVAVAQGCGPHLLEAAAADPDARVRFRLAEALAGRPDAEGDVLLLRLQADAHPHVRAAALTPALAAALVRQPMRETSWHVLGRAARLAQVPVWQVAPDVTWQPPPRSFVDPGPLTVNRPAPPRGRVLGPGGPVVAPVGISGHYGLSVEGFVRAAEAGVNLMFWEPNYQTMTEFMTRLPARDRNALHVVAGTFEADGKRLARDAERVLRTLAIDRVGLFLVFWVQSWARVNPDGYEALQRLKEAGKVAAFGLSTHSRPLAVEAMEQGWDPVMVRHSAAHRGAEARVFPRAVELGTSLLTFNNTCYGRLLKPHGELPPPRAADCYRFTLAQPAVTACLSAPVNLEQLEENLAALRDPELPEDRRRALEAQGERTYEEDTIFRKLVRGL